METIALLLEGHQSCLGMRGKRFRLLQVESGGEWNTTEHDGRFNYLTPTFMVLFSCFFRPWGRVGPKTIILKKLKKMLACEWRVMNCIVNGLWNDQHMEHYAGALNNIHIVWHRSLLQAVMLFVIMAVRSITLYYHNCIREKTNRAQSVVSAQDVTIFFTFLRLLHLLLNLHP